jgi:hypothetical protein
MLACGTTVAQSDVGDEPFMTSGAGETRLFTGTTPIRLWHQTQGYGQDASFTSIGGRWATDLSDAIGFVDGNFRVDNNSKGGGNIGGGFRWFQDGLLLGDPRILGVSTWYDGQESSINKYFNQVGVSFESLGQYVDLRLNANIPLDELKRSDTSTMTGDLAFSGNSLGIATLTPTDVSLRVVDFEVAARVFDFNLWAYGGGYEMDGQGVSAMGRKGGMRGYLTNDLVLSVGVTDDDVFGTNTVVQMIWTPGRTGAGPTWWMHELPDRMREQVYRNQYIALHRIQTEGAIALNNANGSALRIVHVDSNAAAGGDGTAEHPLNNLNAVQGNSQAGDIVLAHANSNFQDQTATIQDQQRFLGEGGGITHTVNTQQMGVVTLTETFAGALNAATPVIDNTGSAINAVTLAATTVNQTGFTPIEVSNFDIIGGTHGIASGANGVGATNINNIDITNTTGTGIQLAAMVEQVSGSSQQLRFQPTISAVSFTSTGGDILLDSNPTNQATGFTTTEAINISNVTSNDTDGVSIDLQNTRRTATLTNINYDGGTTGLGGLRVQNGLSAANVIVNGTNTFAGGTTANADTQGFAINLVNTASTQTITGTTITETGGDSVIVNGGAANMNFTGRIDKTTGPAAGSAVSVLGGHTGTLVFNELNSGQGVINQTVGDGLQFTNADGAYTFNDKVTLNGGDAGIDVLAGSSGTFNFADTANVITSPSGEAVKIDASSAIFTYSGAITANNANAVAITNNTGGSATFNSTIDSTHGILVDSNSGGSSRFSQQVTLTGTDDGVKITNNTGGSTQFDNIDITKTGAGAGFVATSAAAGHTVTVAGNGNVISTQTGVALNLSNIAAGADGINFQSVSSDGAVNGIIINNVTGGAVNIGAGQTTSGAGGSILNSSGTAVSVTNAAIVTFNRLVVDNTAAGFDGIVINLTNGTTSAVSVLDSEIHDGNRGIVYTRSGTASGTSRLTVTGNTVDTSTAEGLALNVNGSGTANITINSNTVVNTSGTSALTFNTSGGSAKSVNLLVDGNTLTNTSTSATANFVTNGAGTLNATVTDNALTNNDATTGRAFAMESASASSIINLNLDQNTAVTGNATPEYLLRETAGDFNVQDLTTVDSRNTGDVEFDPNQAAFDDIPGPVTTP